MSTNETQETGGRTEQDKARFQLYNAAIGYTNAVRSAPFEEMMARCEKLEDAAVEFARALTPTEADR